MQVHVHVHVQVSVQCEFVVLRVWSQLSFSLVHGCAMSLCGSRRGLPVQVQVSVLCELCQEPAVG